MEYLKQIEEFFKCNINEINYISENEISTKEFAKHFAKYLNSYDILCLDGELGSGKTVFMKGIANYFNIETEVSSPTFTIVNEYTTSKKYSDFLEITDEYLKNMVNEILGGYNGKEIK